MAPFTRNESLVTWAIWLPLGVVVNALWLWGFIHVVRPWDAVAWILEAIWLVTLVSAVRRARRVAHRTGR